MNKTFVISVKNKRAKNLSKIKYVCGNSDYTVAFDLDDDWDGIEAKTAKFKESNGNVINTPFTGNTCPFPRIMDAYRVEVGIFASNLKATTNAVVECERSALSSDGPPPDPEPDVYAKLMDMLNKLMTGGEFGAENAGKLVVIGADGKLMPVTLGSEFEIVDDVLRINGQITPPDEPDVPDEPTEEEIYFLQTASGSVVLNGVAFVDLGGGKVLLPNAEFVNDGSGTLMIS